MPSKMDVFCTTSCAGHMKREKIPQRGWRRPRPKLRCSSATLADVLHRLAYSKNFRNANNPNASCGSVYVNLQASSVSLEVYHHRVDQVQHQAHERRHRREDRARHRDRARPPRHRPYEAKVGRSLEQRHRQGAVHRNGEGGVSIPRHMYVSERENSSTLGAQDRRGRHPMVRVHRRRAHRPHVDERDRRRPCQHQCLLVPPHTEKAALPPIRREDERVYARRGRHCSSSNNNNNVCGRMRASVGQCTFSSSSTSLQFQQYRRRLTKTAQLQTTTGSHRSSSNRVIMLRQGLCPLCRKTHMQTQTLKLPISTRVCRLFRIFYAVPSGRDSKTGRSKNTHTHTHAG